MDIARGWFYLADLHPRCGTEPGKTRPVLVVQTDLLNSVGHPWSIVLPVTTQVQRHALPLRIRIPPTHPGFEIDSDIMIDQIRAIDNRRFYRGNTQALLEKIAPAEAGVLGEVERCLLLVMDISPR